MSGAHDVARDAAEKLLRSAQDDHQHEIYLFWYLEEIETIAEYLGVDVKEKE